MSSDLDDLYQASEDPQKIPLGFLRGRDESAMAGRGRHVGEVEKIPAPTNVGADRGDRRVRRYRYSR
jgi:hypothetical protein